MTRRIRQMVNVNRTSAQRKKLAETAVSVVLSIQQLEIPVSAPTVRYALNFVCLEPKEVAIIDADSGHLEGRGAECDQRSLRARHLL